MADNKSVEVLQDGQLAVATVAQTGTIISEPSATDKTALVQTDDGAQLCMKVVNVGGGGGGGGGASAPTLTWYTGNTGTTVTIADTSAAQRVKVYRNGILLQEGDGNDYKISTSNNVTTLTLATALIATDKITTEVF